MKIGASFLVKGKLERGAQRCEKLGVGFEKLDRDAFDPSDKYEKLSNLGVKWVRLGSGWEKTEKEKGVYDFSWIDKVVDNILARGMTPWMCLLYGNPLYTERAKEVFGSVGCPPVSSEEEKEAWRNYCTAFATHFKGRVNVYEIWNEPDGTQCWKHGVNGSEYGAFCAMTAEVIRSVNPSAYIVGGAMGVIETKYAQWLSAALAAGMAKSIDALSYHHYTTKPEENVRFCQNFRAILEEYGCKAALIHGESGCPSTNRGNGSLHACAWNERKQAKHLLRTMATDLACGVEFSSWFSLIDMVEALFGERGNVASYQDYGYFGLLSATFDEQGLAVGEFPQKQAYYAYQNLAAFLGEGVRKAGIVMDSPSKIAYTAEWSLDYVSLVENAEDLMLVPLKKGNARAVLYYKPTPILTTEFESVATVRFSGVEGEICLVDLMTGEILSVPEENIERNNGYVTVKQFPVKDYPMAMVFGDFITCEQ